MPTPLVTIIIPTYKDDPQHLAQAVGSAQAQTYPNIELVVVDDGSTPPVSLPGITVIRQDNAGVATARNTGIRATRGEIIVCLDADDRISPTYAEEVVAVLADPSVAIAAPARVERFGEGSGTWADTGRSFTLPDFVQRSPVPVTSAFRRVDWETAGGYHEAPAMRPGHEDHEWWIRLLGRCGGRTQPAPTAVLHYRVRSGSAFHRGNLAEDERVTREQILERSDRATLEQLLRGAWTHADQLEKDLERARENRVKAWAWRMRKALRGTR